jgi:hypothetical protein
VLQPGFEKAWASPTCLIWCVIQVKEHTTKGVSEINWLFRTVGWTKGSHELPTTEIRLVITLTSLDASSELVAIFGEVFHSVRG